MTKEINKIADRRHTDPQGIDMASLRGGISDNGIRLPLLGNNLINPTRFSYFTHDYSLREGKGFLELRVASEEEKEFKVSSSIDLLVNLYSVIGNISYTLIHKEGTYYMNMRVLVEPFFILTNHMRYQINVLKDK
jgi:hypothetical protein